MVKIKKRRKKDFYKKFHKLVWNSKVNFEKKGRKKGGRDGGWKVKKRSKKVEKIEMKNGDEAYKWKEKRGNIRWKRRYWATNPCSFKIREGIVHWKLTLNTQHHNPKTK